MILTSWKEIASHLNYAVRTAQRWEQHGLPVRRPIDSWLIDANTFPPPKIRPL